MRNDTHTYPVHQSFKTMSITSLMISNAEGVKNSEYIANAFWSQNIAQVSSIVLLPYLKNNKLYQMAYIEIAGWCDSEVAYNFIRRLKVLEGEARLNHNLNEDWWSVQINTHYDGQPFIDASTVTFSQKTFVKAVEEVEDGETLTDSEFESDNQSFTSYNEASYNEAPYSEASYNEAPYSEASYNEAPYSEAPYNEDLLDQKMYLGELLDEKMYVKELCVEEMYDTTLSATTLYPPATYDGLQSLYDQALTKDADELKYEEIIDQYLCDKYHTYQFLCAQ
jgi:hypothetical protein